jgi:hypothetical protein
MNKTYERTHILYISLSLSRSLLSASARDTCSFYLLAVALFHSLATILVTSTHSQTLTCKGHTCTQFAGQLLDELLYRPAAHHEIRSIYCVYMCHVGRGSKVKEEEEEEGVCRYK